MQIRIIPPNYQVASFINQLWRFESDEGITNNDSRLIVPNGTAKLIVPLQNQVKLSNTHLNEILQENTIYLYGISDIATEISSTQSMTRVIGVDLNPFGIARIFPHPMKNYRNTLLTLTDVFEDKGQKLQGEFSAINNLGHCIYFLQNMLYQLIDRDDKKYYIFDYCIKLINESSGTIGVQELVKKTGYTKRYLAMIFNEFVGLSPKTYASVIRFNKLYENWAKSNGENFYTDFLYEYYFDQPHFIKEFKKFTGYSPLKFSEIGNEYGKLFYNDFPFLQSYG